MAEVDLGQLLPPEALAPFADELKARERRRERKLQVRNSIGLQLHGDENTVKHFQTLAASWCPSAVIWMKIL